MEVKSLAKALGLLIQACEIHHTSWGPLVWRLDPGVRSLAMALKVVKPLPRVLSSPKAWYLGE